MGYIAPRPRFIKDVALGRKTIEAVFGRRNCPRYLAYMHRHLLHLIVESVAAVIKHRDDITDEELREITVTRKEFDDLNSNQVYVTLFELGYVFSVPVGERDIGVKSPWGGMVYYPAGLDSAKLSRLIQRVRWV